MNTKTCQLCGTPLTGKQIKWCSAKCSKSGRHKNYSKEKKRARRLRWRELHPEQWRLEKREYMRRRYARIKQTEGKEVRGHKEYTRGTINLSSQVLKKFGITQEEIDDLYEAQEGECKICHIKLKRQWITEDSGERDHICAVDHDHVTGTVRGLLCVSCNFGLGHFKDDIWRLKNAISYLEEAIQVTNKLAAD